MALLIEGRFTGKAVHGDVGRRSPKAPVTVNIDVEITDGEHKGKRFQYVGKCDERNIKYTRMAAKSVGWKGKDIVQTLDRDIKAANLTIDFDLKIAEFERDGQLQQWTAVDRIYGIREAIPVSADETAQVNSWFDEPDSSSSGASGGGGSYDSRNAGGGGYGGHPNAPGNDDIPFASADIAHEPSPIASILRRTV